MIAGDAIELRNVLAVTPAGVKRASVTVRDGVIVDVADLSGGIPERSGEVIAAGEREACPDTPARTVIDAGGRRAIPGFIDLHIHGANGFDAMDGNAGSLRALSETLVKWGVTAYCPTTVAASRQELCKSLEGIAEGVSLSRGPNWKGAEIVGSHCEGPYFARNRRGAQPESAIRNPNMEEVGELWESSRGTLRIFSLAPELPGAISAIEWLRQRGVTVSAGHTDASFEEAMRGVKAGISQSTHTFNGMRPMAHRDPGIVCAVLTADAVDAEVIADGMHVHPEMVKLLVRVKGTDRVIAVSDLTHMAGLPPGLYSLGDTPVELTASGAFVRGTGGLAGSVSPLLVAFNNLLKWGFGIEDAVRLTSSNAARKLGLERRKGAIAPGMDADIVVLNDDGTVFLTMVRGRILYRT
ncbi:MAG TPA: N-acetylglucosamine-6-phosphate deacetylase [Firmicutes bacterium]|nr:N-acetylglucosamine-6-phosphate deacetylase [Candidatus Fermentithermobacillaceae bacterium]